ncbi:hypothetical protein D3C86_1457090 [compost metagenome]
MRSVWPLPSIPEWERAMTISAPSSFMTGTQAFAASTISRVWALPSRFLESHIMICGGTKPMMPTLTGLVTPPPSRICFSRMT